MAKRTQIQKKSSSHFTPTPATGMFQPRPFAEPVQPETATPEVQTKVELGNLESDRLSRMSVETQNPVETGNFGSGQAPPIQAKLTIGAPGDQYEQEADTVAKMVMKMPAISASASPENPTPQSSVVQASMGSGVRIQAASTKKNIRKNKPFSIVTFDVRGARDKMSYESLKSVHPDKILDSLNRYRHSLGNDVYDPMGAKMNAERRIKIPINNRIWEVWYRIMDENSYEIQITAFYVPSFYQGQISEANNGSLLDTVNKRL